MPESRSDSDTGTAPVSQCSWNTFPEHVPGTRSRNTEGKLIASPYAHTSALPTDRLFLDFRAIFFQVSPHCFWQHDSPGVPEKSGYVFADYYIIGNPSSFYHTNFVCLFVCLFVGIKPEKSYSASCVGREVNPLGVITHGQRHKPRAYQRQRHIPRTCQSMFYTLQMSLSMCYCSYFSILLSFTSLILP